MTETSHLKSKDEASLETQESVALTSVGAVENRDSAGDLTPSWPDFDIRNHLDETSITRTAKTYLATKDLNKIDLEITFSSKKYVNQEEMIKDTIQFFRLFIKFVVLRQRDLMDFYKTK